MSQLLSITDTLQGGGAISDDVTDAVQRVAFGGAILPAIQMAFAHGTGDGQANKLFAKRFTLAALTFDLHDLSTLEDFQGVALDLDTVRRVLVAIIDPDGTKELRVGPQNQANALDGFWGGAGATVYDRVWHHQYWYRPNTGVAVDATHKVFPVYNPHATLPLTYALFVLGAAS